MTDTRLPDELESNARVRIKVSGVDKGTRRILNLFGASAVDDSINEEVEITFTLSGLSDVDVTPISDGNVLVWDTDTNTWIAGSVSSSGELIFRYRSFI